VNDRIVLPELLDVLPPRDLAALRSRRDLRRVNAWMRHPQIMAAALRENWTDRESPLLVELGAGDGHFLLNVARRVNGRWPATQAILVDRLQALDPQTREAFRLQGWRIRAETAEAADWLRRSRPPAPHVMLSNLFFHQFEPAALQELLRLAAKSARLVIALEPRRSGLARLGGRLLWAIGCGPVTRHDAQISIRAGFKDGELSALWPEKSRWRLTERRAGLFSHLFIARRED
jgi:hypothetical protein